MTDPAAAERAGQERDLYLQCLELVHSSDPAPLLADALALLRRIAGAERGLIEVQDLGSNGTHRWAIGVDDEERQRIEERISRGVIAEAIATGEIVHTPSALLDERFRHRESVRQASIETVLCVPLRAEGIVGVVYLQNRVSGGPFSDADVACVQTVARFVSSLAGRLLELRRRRGSDDRTASVRSRLRADGVIGQSAALADLLEQLEIIAAMEANVLLTGSHGTGKSLFARVLHDNSPRASGPFVEVNCATLPEPLVESELFGAERGAYSGVGTQGRIGRVAAAEKGTLFLDEIAELPIAIQAKLLQLVQDKQYFRLGGTTPIRADVRIVTATNRDLEEAMADRRFREDLYYRIRIVQLRIPSLAERRDDIGMMAQHFCASSCRRDNLPTLEPSPAAISALEVAEWVGSIRELAGACESALVRARRDGAGQVEVRHFFPTAGPDEPPTGATFQGAKQQWERAFLGDELDRRNWNIALTARDLDMSRAHLNALIKRYGLVRKG
ncbi:MAG TPA: sigma-54-dependent Fis family transcriptional regulator [Nannocystaceae bacterium]|nr:sigma-54-dependent Fis family transcriptional regulator [Nannocystaceae bacterium]